MIESDTFLRAGRIETKDGWLAFLTRVDAKDAYATSFKIDPAKLVVVVGPYETEEEAELACDGLYNSAAKTAEKLGGFVVPDKKDLH